MDLSKNHGIFIHAEQYQNDKNNQNDINNDLSKRIDALENSNIDTNIKILYDNLDLTTYHEKGITHFLSAEINTPVPIVGITNGQKYNGFLINISLYENSIGYDSILYISNLDSTQVKIYVRTVNSENATEAWQKVTTA